MAIYHFNVKIIHRTQRNPDGTRSAPRSVVAKLAYRAGTKLTDHQTGQTWDFSNKSEVAQTRKPGRKACVVSRKL